VASFVFDQINHFTHFILTKIEKKAVGTETALFHSNMHQIVFQLGRRTGEKEGKGSGKKRRDGWGRKWRGGYVYRRRKGTGRGKGRGIGERKGGKGKRKGRTIQCCLKLFRGPAKRSWY